MEKEIIINKIKEELLNIAFDTIEVVQNNDSYFNPIIYYVFYLNGFTIETPISNIKNYNCENEFYEASGQSNYFSYLDKEDLKSIRKALKLKLMSLISENKDKIEEEIVKGVITFMKPKIKSTFDYLNKKTELTYDESENVIHRAVRQLLLESLL